MLNRFVLLLPVKPFNALFRDAVQKENPAFKAGLLIQR